MKVYRVHGYKSEWHLISPSTGVPIGASSDIGIAVEWARLLANKYAGEVHVYDRLGHLQEVYFGHATAPALEKKIVLA